MRAAAQTWATFQANIGHTGFVPTVLNPAGFVTVWQTQFPHAVALQQPAGGDGRVFVTENGYQLPEADLIAVDAQTGATLWTSRYQNMVNVNPPAYSEGRVYIQTTDYSNFSVLRCYDAGGLAVYQARFGSLYGRYLAPTVDSGNVYINGGTYGGMYAFSASDGTLDWFNHSLPEYYDWWTPTLDANEAYGYVGGDTPGVYAVNRVTGLTDFVVVDRKFSSTSNSMGEAVALSGTTGFVTQNNRLIAFDLARIKIAWQISRNCTGQPAVAGNTVYTIDGGALSAFDASNGALLWAWQPPNSPLTGTIIVTSNVVFVGTNSATYAIDLTSHTQVWSANIGGERAIVDGKLLIAGKTGTLTAVYLSPIPQLAGTVTLGDFSGPVAGRQVTIQVRNPGSMTVLDTYSAKLNQKGQFSLDTSRSGTFDVAIKASHWLRRVVRGVTFGPSGATVNATLVNGDVNGDNTVSLNDFAQLRAAFGTSEGIPNWNPEADLNGDGGVGFVDYDILRAHFGQAGDR